jgi:predicted DNA binding protein
LQYAQMVDLIGKAKLAGVRETKTVRDALARAFETWLNRQDLREITDEEVEALQVAFAEGFTNDYKV